MDIIDKIIQQLEEIKDTKNYNAVLTELMNRIYRLSGNRTEYFQIINRILERVDPAISKIPGTSIYDSVAVTAPELQNVAVMLKIFEDQTFLMTATGAELDRWGATFSLSRYQATKAIMKARPLARNGVGLNIDIGARFMSIDTIAPIEYVAIGMSGDLALVECQTEGLVGSSYLGFLIATPSVNNLASMEIVQAEYIGQNREPDSVYRERLRMHLARIMYGGNIWEYKMWVNAINGVWDCVIFPAWQGGGSVKVCIIDSEYKPVPFEFLNIVKSILDPVEIEGSGGGIVPIGHNVIVSTPEFVDLNFILDFEVKPIFKIEQVRPIIKNIFTEYVNDLRENFVNMWQQRLDSGEPIPKEKPSQNPDLPYNSNIPPLDLRFSLIVSWVQILSKVMNSNLVLRVTSLSINEQSGLGQDLILESTKQKQFLPKIKSLIVNGVSIDIEG